MIKSYMLITCALLFAVLGLNAQVITTEPALLQEDSQNVVIYYHADKGNKGLANLAPSVPIYAHTGLITSKSTSTTDWKYTNSSWNINDEKYKMEYVSENLYKLVIGDIRTFYGVSATTETIKNLAFVFRNADGSKTGRNADNSDILVNVVDGGLQVSIVSDLDGTLVTPDNPRVNFTITSTLPARLSLGINGVEVDVKENATLLQTSYLFTEPGTYNIYGNAKTDEKTVSQKIRLAYANNSKPANYPGGVPKMGAVRNADGSVTFCLGAPEKKSVIIMGSWNDFEAGDAGLMNYQDYNGFRYFWITIPNLEYDKKYTYYYIIDGDVKVGDPYARLVLDPSNDKYISDKVYPNLPAYPSNAGVRDVCMAVYQANINDYDWKVKNFKPADKSNLMVYELLLRDFTGTEGKAQGNGTLRQAMEKIDYLKNLGINAIELLPVNEFQGNNSWGYNPNFYFAPDKAYGTPDDYKEFVDLCHANGIAVILDMVFNQSDWQHPWYRMYEVGSNPFFNATAPHAYSVLNDWNQSYPLVRQQWHDIVTYWMTEYNVDGFRFDLVKGLGNNDSYPNNGDSGTNAFNQSRIDNMRDIQTYMLAVNPNAILINENLAQAAEENAMAKFGQLNWANINNEGGQFAMGFKTNSNLNRMYAPRDGRDWGSTVSYLESHDEERLAYKQKAYGATGVAGNEEVSLRRLGAAAAQMILAPGAHMIWQFSELGNAESTKNSSGNNTSPKVVHWNYFDEPARRGLYNSYAELMAIRNSNPDLFSQSATYTPNCGSNNWVTGRSMISTNGSKELFTLINPNIDKEITMTVSFAKTSDSDYHILSKSYGTEPTFSVSAGTVTIPANSYVTIGSKNVTEVKEIAGDGESLLSARGIKGAILIEATDGDVRVYDLNGIELYNGGKGTVEVPAGLYIVCGNNSSRKVVVK